MFKFEVLYRYVLQIKISVTFLPSGYIDTYIQVNVIDIMEALKESLARVEKN